MAVRHYLLSIHGILSNGEWQDDLEPVFEGICEFAYRKYKYGYVSLQTLSEKLRDDRVRDFGVWCLNLAKNARLSVIAHSFGTWIVCEALTRYSLLKFDRVILCGAIVSREYDWSALFAANRVKRVLNELASGDEIVTWLRKAKPFEGTGSSGVDGFLQLPAGLEQRSHPKHKHSEMFLLRSYSERHWRPFIFGQEQFADLAESYVVDGDRDDFDRVYFPVALDAVQKIFAGDAPQMQERLAMLLLPEMARRGREGTDSPEDAAVWAALSMKSHSLRIRARE